MAKKPKRSAGKARPLAGPVELRFEIKAYTPETMPLERLASYLENLAVLLGETQNVHLLRIEGGSTVPVVAVDWESLPKVKKRANDVRNNEGPAEARNARLTIERFLVEDNALFGDLLDQRGARILRFAGVQHAAEPEYGPFAQPGTLDGVPIVVGGTGVTVPVHLQDRGDVIHNCLASRQVAKDISRHLFASPLRVSGVGKWFRDRHGIWSMRRFTIDSFIELTAESVVTATNRLQAIDAAWKHRRDPLSELVSIRDSEP